MTAKFDVKRVLRGEYSGKLGVWKELEAVPARYLMLHGQGDPGGPGFARALAALYPLAYGAKALAKAAGNDFTVPPLQALWQADDPSAFVRGDREAWRWTAMLRMPEAVTAEALEQVRAATLEKQARKKAEPAVLALVQAAVLQDLDEGRCLQTLHIGPYAEEAPVLAQLHSAEMPARGLTFNGPHHEIYLSDARLAAPERLKTLLRQPVRLADAA